MLYKNSILLVFLLVSSNLNADILYKNHDQEDSDFYNIPVPELQEKSARGNIKSKYLLALHETRNEQQKEEGVRQLEELADAGIVDAAYTLHRISNWVNVNSLTPEKALKYLKQGAEGGSDAAQLGLARAYAKGEFGKKDLVTSHYWLEKSAEQHNADAMAYVAINYHRGLGVPKDDKKAFEWLMKSYNILGREFNDWGLLGQAYEEGVGTPVDLAKAYMCYDLYGTAGIEEKERIAPRMTEAQKAEGLRLSEEWQEKNHVYMMQSLGLKHQKDGSYQ